MASASETSTLLGAKAITKPTNTLKQSGLDLAAVTDRIDFDLPEGVIVQVYKHFYSPSEADSLFNLLLDEIAWAEEDILMFGKWVKVPRLMCWYGDVEACYRYSGVMHTPLPWTPRLLSIKEKVECQCGCGFNSVLANLYRDGKDSMGCHSDDEPELGSNPTIASLSLGDERLFRLHHKKSKKTLSISLAHGDLLVMAGTCQRFWLHSVPKTKSHKTARINLTYRKILPD